MASNGYKYLTKLQNAHVLVVGGSSGIGYGVAEAAVEYGALVVISSSNPKRLRDAVNRLNAPLDSPGPYFPERTAARFKECDLADGPNIESNIIALLENVTRGGTELLDHIVFTAGDALNMKGLDEATVESISESSLVRFTAPVLFAKHLPRYMNKSAKSSITLTGGTNSWKPSPGWSAMAGIGSGVEGLGRGFAVDLKPIRVNVVCPGAIKTELWDRFPADKVKEMEEMYTKQTLTLSIGTPEETAEAYLYLMKDSFNTGTVVYCDGGRLLA